MLINKRSDDEELEKEIINIFNETKQEFLHFFPYNLRIKNCKFQILYRKCIEGNSCSPRDLGATYYSKNSAKMVLVSRVMDLPIENIKGIIIHEFGHLADVWLDDKIEGKEKRADLIGELVTGFRIYYDKSKIQTISKKESTFPRPKGIHQ